MRILHIRVGLMVVMGSMIFHSAVLSQTAEEGYTTKKLGDWTVYVNDELWDRYYPATSQVLDLLKVKLYDISREVPDTSLKELTKIPIWIELNDTNDEHDPC